MSRSRRKTPKLAFSGSKSEKDDKARFNRQKRHAAKSALTKTLDAENAKEKHRRSGTWDFGKDGKRWVASPDEKRMRK